MQTEKIIAGAEAIRWARNLKYVPGAWFSLVHITCSMKTGKCGEISNHPRCRVRPSLKEETFHLDGDMYFTDQDLDRGEPRMCFKKLMRYIGFPPDYDLQKISWLDE